MLLSAQLPVQIFQTFFCRMNEPSYIKHTKLEILAALADQSNAYDIVTELTEYVNDIDEKLARKAIQTVGQIALSVNSLRSCLYLRLLHNRSQSVQQIGSHSVSGSDCAVRVGCTATYSLLHLHDDRQTCAAGRRCLHKFVCHAVLP